MRVLFLDPDPSQRMTLDLDGQSYDLRFDYNQTLDRWSVSIWREDETCPIIAGRFLMPGQDILRGFGFDTKIQLTDRPGQGVASANWFERMTREWSDGYPSTMLVIIAPGDLEQLAAIAC